MFIFFGGLEFVGHFFANVAHFVFLIDVWNLDSNPELEFLKNLWGLGTEQEQGYRTGPPGYIGWRN